MRESIYNIWVEYQDIHFVYNTLTGSLLQVEEQQKAAIQSIGQKSTIDPSFKQLLQKGKIIVPDEFDEVSLVERRYQLGKVDNGHLALTLITSLGCNFDCPYCYEEKHPSIIKKNVQVAVLKYLEDHLKSAERFEMHWLGGEPLLAKKSLLSLSQKMIDLCEQHGVSYAADITTNGYLLDEETCQELVANRIYNAQICLDGPPHIHDKMRPLAGGGGTFWQILENLKTAVNYLDVTVRVNADTVNYQHAEELIQILHEADLAGKITIYLGQLVKVDDGASSPSATYIPRCFSSREFAKAEVEFLDMAGAYGFNGPALLRPIATPCTAVRPNELVVGSDGELYKCWENVGNKSEVIGSIEDYLDTNSRIHKWLAYNPFENAECRGCKALPLCMGGCAHHAMDKDLYDNRCTTFRHAHNEQILQFVKSALSH